ncbi:MAG: cation:proton antiporter [Rhodospirillales bacterium]|nr:cation:proton antiporter [Rhodospirillales bacterium]
MEPTLSDPIVNDVAAIESVGQAVSEAVGEAATQAMTDAALHNNLTGIAIVVVAALLCGLGMERLKQPAILGYMLAGVLLGPSALGLVRDQGQISVLAELGVLMLLFVIGMELSLRIFKHIWRLAVAAAALQIAAALAVFWLLAFVFDWPASVAVLMGFVVAMSSTAVAIKILQDAGELKTRAGRIAVAVLIAQDMAVVPMMLTIGVMGRGGFDWMSAVSLSGAVALLGGLLWYLSSGRKLVLPMPAILTAKREELGALVAVALCFGAAAISGLLGLSAAYGAFVAGLVIGNSNLKTQVFHEVKPIQAVLMMVFFLSIGLLIDLAYIWQHLGAVLAILFMVTVFKTVLNVGIVRVLGQPWPVAVVSGIALAQIGEFSFLLAAVAVSSGVIPAETSRLVVSVTVLSLLMSPLWTTTARRLHGFAADGILSVGEVWDIAWGRETELAKRGLSLAGGRTARLVERLKDAAEAVQERRAQARLAAKVINDNPSTPALDAAPPPPQSADAANNKKGKKHA